MAFACADRLKLSRTDVLNADAGETLVDKVQGAAPGVISR